MTVYTPAPEVAKIARGLITKHHTHLVDPGDVRIEYLFRDAATRSRGRTIWAKARKVTGLSAFLAAGDTLDDGEAAEPFFVIEVAADVWHTLSGKEKIALVDHELSHCKIEVDNDGNAKIALAGHDLEEFEMVVRRHGLWRSDVKRFAKVALDYGDQLNLLDDDEPDPAGGEAGGDGDGPGLRSVK